MLMSDTREIQHDDRLNADPTSGESRAAVRVCFHKPEWLQAVQNSEAFMT